MAQNALLYQTLQAAAHAHLARCHSTATVNFQMLSLPLWVRL